MYTYIISKALSEAFNCEFVLISDQLLNIIPEDVLSKPHKIYSNLGTVAAKEVVKGKIWITDGISNEYHDPKQPIPENWRSGRTMQHMSHKNPDKWREITSKSAIKQWDDNTERKKIHSNKMKKMWEDNYEFLAEKSRINGDNGLKGKTHPRSLLLEYKGVNYYGWRELEEVTGITKNLYKKYYLNGIDPTPRIGKNGPAASTLTMDKIHKGGST